MLPEPLAHHQGTFFQCIFSHTKFPPFQHHSFLLSHITQTKGCWEISSPVIWNWGLNFSVWLGGYPVSVFSATIIQLVSIKHTQWIIVQWRHHQIFSHPWTPHRKEKKKKGWGEKAGGKGQETSVINRQHPVNFTHMGLCDTYSVSVKLKPEPIKKKSSI